MRSLIVDDEPACRKMLMLFLRDLGPVTEAPSGRAAIETVKQALIAGERFDFIALDIAMADMDGHAALIAIRAMEEIAGFEPGRGAIVVMTSAHHDAPTVFAAFREQCSGFLPKPITQSSLLTALAEHGLIPG